MLTLNFNTTAIRSYLGLSQVDEQIGIVQERLSTGKRINRSSDDPAGLTLANAMRYSLRGLEQATGNIEDGTNMLQTAEGGMNELSAILNKMRTLALSAANDGVNEPAQLQALQAELDSLVTSMDQMANSTDFNGIKLLNGTLSDNTLDRTIADAFGRRSNYYYQALRHDSTKLVGGIVEGSTLEIQPPSGNLNRSHAIVNYTQGGAIAAITASVQGIEQNGVTLDAVNGKTMTLTGPDGTQTITFSATTRIVDIVSLVNAQTESTGLRAGYNEKTGDLTIESVNYGATTVNIVSQDMTSGASTIGVFDSDTTAAANAFLTAGTNQTVDIIYQSLELGTQIVTLTQDPTLTNGRSFSNGAFFLELKDTTDGSVGSSIEAPIIEFEAIRRSTTWIHTGANTDDRTNIEIPDLRSGAMGRGAQGVSISSIVSIESLKTQSVLQLGNPDDALRIIDKAIEQLGLARGRIGALQANAMEKGLDFLNLSTENLKASESRIRDADFAKESAEFARLQINYQAAIAMLAQANQIPQSVLRLLQG
jgi:flagellin